MDWKIFVGTTLAAVAGWLWTLWRKAKKDHKVERELLISKEKEQHLQAQLDSKEAERKAVEKVDAMSNKDVHNEVKALIQDGKKRG